MSSQAFDAAAARTLGLDALLSQLIPASQDGRLPAAGELELADAIFAAGAADPDFGPTLKAGLEALEAAAAEEGEGSFGALAEERRLAVLQGVADAQPELLPRLLGPTCTAYYATPKVAMALGMETWPPHPEGFPLETGDLSLLDPVRSRGPCFREV
jgi:hypothetical protein